MLRTTAKTTSDTTAKPRGGNVPPCYFLRDDPHRPDPGIPPPRLPPLNLVESYLVAMLRPHRPLIILRPPAFHAKCLQVNGIPLRWLLGGRRKSRKLQDTPSLRFPAIFLSFLQPK